MKIFLILFLLFTSHLNGQGQVLEKRIQKFAIENNIDSFLVYHYSCNYCIIDDCSWEEPHYLFWQQAGSWYVKRFDYCQTFQTLQLDSLNALAFYFGHHNGIDNEEVSQPTNKKIIKRKGRKDGRGIGSPARFTCLYEFNFHAAGQSKKVIADAYYLNLEKYDNEMENVYHSSYQKNKLKILIDMTENMVKKFNAENRFIAEQSY